jgi:hypothetical protein
MYVINIANVMYMSKDKINVTIKEETHRRLKALGSKDETFDAIITRLLDFYDTTRSR